MSVCACVCEREFVCVCVSVCVCVCVCVVCVYGFGCLGVHTREHTRTYAARLHVRAHTQTQARSSSPGSPKRAARMPSGRRWRICSAWMFRKLSCPSQPVGGSDELRHARSGLRSLATRHRQLSLRRTSRPEIWLHSFRCSCRKRTR